VVEELKKIQALHDLQRNRPGRLDLGEPRLRHRQDHRRCDGQGRKEGVITVEDGKIARERARSRRGHAVRRGYLSPYFINNPEKQICVLEDPYILLYDKKISSIRELLPLLEQVAKAGSRCCLSPRNRRRGARHAGGEQHPRHPEDLRREGAGLRDRARRCSKTWRFSPAAR